MFVSFFEDAAILDDFRPWNATPAALALGLEPLFAKQV